MRAPSSIIAHAQKLRSIKIKYSSSVPHNYPACCAQEMKAEINEYNILVDKAFRVEDDMQPEFNLIWRANEAVIPKFAFVLRAVLANSPNSIPPEWVFSCVNNFFTPGHENSYSDYIKYATQLQFNYNQST